MNEKYIKYKIESIVNNLLYENDVIEKNVYEEVSRKLDKLLFELSLK